MDIIKFKQHAISIINKNKYILLLLCFGLLCVTVPKSRSERNSAQQVEIVEEEISFSQQLEEILSKIDGAGEVNVLLTVAEGEQTIYQTDENITEQENASSIQSDTLILSASDKSQVGLVRQTLPPIYLGAIVVCEGADHPAVKLAIVEAVSKVTGLNSNQISVLKMN